MVEYQIREKQYFLHNIAQIVRTGLPYEVHRPMLKALLKIKRKKRVKQFHM